MKITVEPSVMLDLMTIAVRWSNEFSGFGFVERRGEDLHVYDFVPLAMGSVAYTEIPVSKLLEISKRADAKNMRCWVHRHPVGNGIPGLHNWSGTDNNTIETNPLGSPPELMGWSCSMVLTPHGWVGRVDNHLTKKTKHLEVTPQSQIMEMVNKLTAEYVATKAPVWSPPRTVPIEAGDDDRWSTWPYTQGPSAYDLPKSKVDEPYDGEDYDADEYADEILRPYDISLYEHEFAAIGPEDVIALYDAGEFDNVRTRSDAKRVLASLM